MRALRTSAWILALLLAFLPIAQANVVYAYVTNDHSGSVSVINTSTNKVVKTIRGFGQYYEPYFVAVNPAGSFAYVASCDPYNGKCKFSVISTAANTIVSAFTAAQPLSIVFAPNGKTAYAAYSRENAVGVINTVTMKYIKTIDLPSGFPSGQAVSPDGKFLYVVNQASGTVSVISTATNQIVTNIELVDLQGGLPGNIAISRDGSTAYVPYFNPLHPQDPYSGIEVIDTISNAVVNSIYDPDEPVSATVSPDGHWLYVAQAGILGVRVIDTSTQAIANTVDVGLPPTEVAFTPDSAFAYVANLGGGGVPVINTSTQTETGQVYLRNNFYPINIAVMP